LGELPVVLPSDLSELITIPIVSGERPSAYATVKKEWKSN